jgi:putative transposase
MPRLARIVFPDLPHHITQRGNCRENVFFTDDDRYQYLAWLKDYCQQHQVRVLAYCLMSNHIHLIAIPTQADSLKTFVHALCPIYQSTTGLVEASLVDYVR